MTLTSEAVFYSMHTKVYTSQRFARRAQADIAHHPYVPSKATHSPINIEVEEFSTRVRLLVRNPLFLVIVTWLVMAGLLVMEIVGGK